MRARVRADNRGRRPGPPPPCRRAVLEPGIRARIVTSEPGISPLRMRQRRWPASSLDDVSLAIDDTSARQPALIVSVRFHIVILLPLRDTTESVALRHGYGNPQLACPITDRRCVRREWDLGYEIGSRRRCVARPRAVAREIPGRAPPPAGADGAGGVLRSWREPDRSSARPRARYPRWTVSGR